MHSSMTLSTTNQERNIGAAGTTCHNCTFYIYLHIFYLFIYTHALDREQKLGWVEAVGAAEFCVGTAE